LYRERYQTVHPPVNSTVDGSRGVAATVVAQNRRYVLETDAQYGEKQGHTYIKEPIPKL
jgi:hypothetical protein